MRFLILGGTVFLGRHIVSAAQTRGHRVTLFNRGKSDPRLFPDVEHLLGDRDGDLGALELGHWDTVVDTSGYIPSSVGKSAALLADRAAHYTFISSCAVYADVGSTPAKEDSPTLPLTGSAFDRVRDYGALKAACERTLEEHMPGRGLIIRSAVMAGPSDPTDRFTYWLKRIAAGGDVLVPKPFVGQTQLIDVRDLATWIVTMAEQGKTGVFNAAREAVPLQTLLEICREALGSAATFVQVDEEFLLRRRVQPSVDLPLWVPSASSTPWLMNVARANDEGLRGRLLAETARATLLWHERQERHLTTGLHEIRERELLRAWRARPSAQS